MMRHTGKKLRENVSKILIKRNRFRIRIHTCVIKSKRKLNSSKTFVSAGKVDGA